MRLLKLLLWFATIFIISGCGVQAATPDPTRPSTQIPTETATFAATPVPSNTPLPSSTATPLPSSTPSPSPSPSPSLSPTPTSEFPRAVVIEERAFCRYGPGTAYLYSHELNKDETAEVHGRNASSTWLWLKPTDLERHCWAAASVLDVDRDIATVNVVSTRLPQSTLYGPPEDVDADRDGDEVTIRWDEVWMTEDDFRGYLVEATVCQGGGLVFVALQTDDNSLTITDEGGCSGASEGRLYTVEKHGYTDPIDIPWP